uniref:Uncharacterized protein n=1 Tax=Acrobeloides nanus TaxID=290746 RepID=A0A914DK66_9BILA
MISNQSEDNLLLKFIQSDNIPSYRTVDINKDEWDAESGSAPWTPRNCPKKDSPERHQRISGRWSMRDSGIKEN